MTSTPPEVTAFQAVLESAGAGEPWAFENLFDRVARRLAGFLRARGAHDADGLTNEVLLRAFRNIRDFDGNETQFRAWVFTIARNVLIDEHRKRSRRPEAIPTEPADMPDITSPAAGDAFEDQVVDARLRRHLEALSDDQRDVLLLRTVADLSIEETAEIVGKSQGAVKALQHRAVRTLRKRLGDSP